MESNRISRFYYWTLLGMMALFFGVMLYYVPFVFDDMMFKRMYIQANGGSEDFSFKALYDFIMSYRLDDNSRLSNLLDPVFCMFLPKWLFAVVTALFAVGMYHLACRLSVGRGNVLMLNAMLWVSFFVFPWRDFIFVADYALNYIWPSFFLLLLLAILVRSKRGRLSPSIMAAGCVTALITGLLHEGHNICLLAGLGMYAASCRFKMPAQWWVLVGIFTAGLVWLVTSSGLQGRAASELGLSTEMPVLTMAFYVSLPVVMLLVIAARLTVRGGTAWLARMIRSQVFVTCAIGSLVGLAFPLLFRACYRYGWMSQLLAMVALGYMLAPSIMKLSRQTRLAVSMTLTAAFVVFAVNTARVQRLYSKQYEEVLSLMMSSPSGTVYYDTLHKDLYRKQTLYMTVRCMLDGPWALKSFNWGYADADRMLSVVPSVMASLNVADAEPVAGTARMLRHKGELLCRYDWAYKAVYDSINVDKVSIDTLKIKSLGLDIRYQMADGTSEQLMTSMYLFLAPQGDTLLYCNPEKKIDKEAIVSADWCR